MSKRIALLDFEQRNPTCAHGMAAPYKQANAQHVVTTRAPRERLSTAQIKMLQRGGGREQKKKEPKP